MKTGAIKKRNSEYRLRFTTPPKRHCSPLLPTRFNHRLTLLPSHMFGPVPPFRHFITTLTSFSFASASEISTETVVIPGSSSPLVHTLCAGKRVHTS
ncbi:hypothetical protein ACTXT7_016190 [Hymenolepis weldensis]